MDATLYHYETSPCFDEVPPSSPPQVVPGAPQLALDD